MSHSETNIESSSIRLQSSKKRRYAGGCIDTRCLNALKFFAACMIAFVWHYQHFKPQNGSPFASIFKFGYKEGWLMVELFFTLSGFGMYLGYAEKIRKRQITFGEYILKRLKKLYPIFFLTLLLITVLELWHKHLSGKTFVYGNFDCWHFFLNLIFCQDGVFGKDWSFNAPSWCISICFILYIVHFAVMYFTQKNNYALYVYILLMFIGLTIVKTKIEYPFLLNSLFGRGLSCFSVGVILANIYQNSDKLNTVLIGHLSLILLALLYAVYVSDHKAWLGDMHFLFIMLISPLMILSLLYVPWLNRLFSIRPLLYLGSLSISIFLFHFLMQCTIRNFDLALKLELNYSSKKVWLLYAGTTIVVSAAYNKFAEKGVNSLFPRTARVFLRERGN